jgi:selenide,water dikinase
VLRPIENLFDQQDYPNLVVGLNAPDDAAVWKVDDQRGLVVTTDFFTPVVDDPLDYGRIAAANSLSDIYAMGGKPFLALNIAALPPDLDSEFSSQIILGGAEVAKKAGVIIAGGHTVQDKEPKYGLVVVGFVELDKMFTKAGARAGDMLYLTKPLGFGTITTALKQEKADMADLAAAVKWMVTLNDAASLAGQKAGVRSATDITGYGLIGHASEMAIASQVSLEFDVCNIPILPNARKYADQMIFPGGSYDNRYHYEHIVQIDRELDEANKMLFFDPQTSGGLLLAVPPGKTDLFEAEMAQLGSAFWQVGRVTDGEGIRLK